VCRESIQIVNKTGHFLNLLEIKWKTRKRSARYNSLTAPLEKYTVWGIWSVIDHEMKSFWHLKLVQLPLKPVYKTAQPLANTNFKLHFYKTKSPEPWTSSKRVKTSHMLTLRLVFCRRMERLQFRCQPSKWALWDVTARCERCSVLGTPLR